MTIKAFFTLLSVTTVTTASSQSVKLVNLTESDKDSKAVYIALDNVFSIQDPEQITGIVPQEGVVLQSGQLRIRANVTGKLPVTFLTSQGKEVVTFEAKTAPSPVVAIGDWTNQNITRERLLNKSKLCLTSFKNGDTFFQGYQITYFQVQLSGQAFTIEGNEFSPELLRAIQTAKGGEVLILSAVKAYNMRIKQQIELATKTAFTIE